MNGSEPLNLAGLSSSEAQSRLAANGSNELPGQAPRSLLRITREVLTEPMFLLLLGAASVYLTLGNVREATALCLSIFVVLAITILQERRTEHALTRLRELSSPRALVIRDGKELRIAGREIVVDDLTILREGDRIPADGVLLSATALSIDESILTGESLPVEKSAMRQQGESTSDDCKVYSGTLVVRGFGIAKITATGARSEIGTIGVALKTLHVETTPLYREVRRIVRWVAVAGLLLCALIAVLYALARHDWLGGTLAGITVAMGVLPEEFPVVLTVFLAMGAWRISRAGVLTRRMPAVESIGAATILAVDKTGTLTQNKMEVAILDTDGVGVDLRQNKTDLSSTCKRVLATALAASESDAFDPMERAVHEAANRWYPEAQTQLQERVLLKEYDLTPELLAVTHVWSLPNSGQVDVAVKGAPETVFELCKVAHSERATLLERVATYARSGLRVLAVARGEHVRDALPETPFGYELHLVGFICFSDPLRDSVPQSLAECYAAGIRVIMITGDHAGTALAIAKQAGFETRSGVLTGQEIEKLSEEELKLRVRDINLFARAKPEHKLRLVQALKANGEVVAMTGDGVNDAPALKAAHIGVAMGGRGTDVAREAAALVLVNDDFASLVNAVRLGRRIYANIRHAMSFIVAVHVPIAGLGLIPVLLGWPLMFFPMHVLFMEFVIDPACAFVFEADAESPDIMQRKPRSPTESLFSRSMLSRNLILGTAILAFALAVYGISLLSVDEKSARTLAFIGLVVANLSLIFVSRSRSESLATIYARPNKIYWWIVSLTLAALVVATYVKPVAGIFNFSTPALLPIILVSLGAVSLVLFGGKLLRKQNAF